MGRLTVNCVHIIVAIVLIVGSKAHAKNADLKEFMGDSDTTDDEVVELISLAPGLVDLDLSKCNGISDKSLRAIAGLRQLESLALPPKGKFSEAGFRNIRSLTLRRLYTKAFWKSPDILRSCLLSFASISESPLPEPVRGALSEVDASDRSEDMLRALEGLHGILALKVGGKSKETNQLTDTGLQSIPRIPDLQTLYLSVSDGVTDDGIAILGACKQLRSLRLKVSDGSSPRISANCLEGLAGLNLSDLRIPANILNDDAFSHYLNALHPGLRPSIKFASMTTCLQQLATNDGLPYYWPLSEATARAAASCKELVAIEIVDGHASGKALGPLFSSPALQVLELRGTYDTDCFVNIDRARALRQLLLTIDAERCDDKVLRDILKSTSMKDLYISNGALLTEPGLLAVAEAKQLKEIKIGELELRRVVEAKLKALMPNCQITLDFSDR